MLPYQGGNSHGFVLCILISQTTESSHHEVRVKIALFFQGDMCQVNRPRNSTWPTCWMRRLMKISCWIWKTNECIFLGVTQTGGYNSMYNVYIKYYLETSIFLCTLVSKTMFLAPQKKTDWTQPRLSTESHREGNQTEPALKLSTYPAMTVARPRRKNHRRLHGWEECIKKWVWNGLKKENYIK